MYRYLLVLMVVNSTLLQAYRPDGYIGCFRDWGNRILTGKSRISKTNNSGDECIKFCKADNYRYAGTESKDECFCGHTLRVQMKAYDCTHVCTGNINEICGGHWRISMYDISLVKKDTSTAVYSTPTTKEIITTKLTTRKTTRSDKTFTYVPTSKPSSNGSTQTLSNMTLEITQNPHSGLEDNSSGPTIIIVPVILTLVAIFVIVLAVIVMKKRRKRNGDNINQAYHEPTEKAPGKQQASTDESGKILQQSDDTSLHNEVAATAAAADAAAQSTDYEMLQHQVDSGSEYTSLERQSSRKKNMIYQDGLYEMLNKENQPEDLYSKIK